MFFTTNRIFVLKLCVALITSPNINIIFYKKYMVKLVVLKFLKYCHKVEDWNYFLIVEHFLPIWF